MRFGPVLAILLTTAFVTPGCVGAADKVASALGMSPSIISSSCGSPPRVMLELNVGGATAPLERVVLRNEAPSLAALSCTGPPFTETVVASGPSTAKGAVYAQSYEEMRLHFADGIVRIVGAFPLTANRSVSLDVSDLDNLSIRHGKRLTFAVRDVERIDAPHTLDDHSAQLARLPLASGSHELSFRVNSSWNHGAYVGFGIGHDYAPAESERPATAPGARIDVRLMSPNGTVVRAADVRERYAGEDFHVPNLEPGEWRLVVETRAADEGASAGYFHASVSFVY